MSKFLLASNKGELLPVARKLQEEGATVLLWSARPEAKHVGKGIVPIADSVNLPETDMKRAYLILNSSAHSNYFDLNKLGWRVLGDKEIAFPNTTFQMTKLLGALGQPMPATSFPASLDDISLNGIPLRISRGVIGDDVVIGGEEGEAWLKWQSGRPSGPFVVQETPDCAEVELAFWCISGKLLTPMIAAVARGGQLLAWAESGDVVQGILNKVCESLGDYTGPLWTTIQVIRKPKQVLLRTISGDWPPYMWSAFLALLDGQLRDFLEDLFRGEPISLQEGWAWVLPVADMRGALPFTSIASILKDCPIDGEGHTWDAYKTDEDVLAGGVSSTPVTLWGLGDTPGAAQERAQERWMNLSCPFKSPDVLDSMKETVDKLRHFKLCTKEA